MSTPGRLELDDTVRARRVETPRGTFATLEIVGSAAPLPRGDVLLVAGFTGSKEDFASLLPLLAKAGWSAAAYDQRGQHETTGGPTDDYSLQGFAADLAAVSSAVYGDHEAVHLVGHSFGGLVATVAAITDPGRWASLTLVCSGPGGLPAGPGRTDAQHAAEAIPRDGLESVYQARLAREADLGLPAPPPRVEAFLHQRFLANAPESLTAIARLLSEAPDRTDDLAALPFPVTLIRGADDNGWPHEVQDRLATALGTHVEVIDGAGHSPAAEQPEATRDALARAFLR